MTLDFAPELLGTGADRWLEVGVRPAGAAGMNLLAPRSPIIRTPYAIHARSSPGRAPVGTVVDWWRANPATPVPPGYQVCDGSAVNDPESPLNGQLVPDLRARFTMGSVDGSTVGQSGGTTTHSHPLDLNHDHASQATGTDGAHTHNTNPPSLGGSTSTGVAAIHLHRWLFSQGMSFASWNEAGIEELMTSWTGDGVGNEGSGYYPICDQSGRGAAFWYTDKVPGHAHTYNLLHDHLSFNSAQADLHSHVLDLASPGTSGTTTNPESSVPPYYGLLKIICIK